MPSDATFEAVQRQLTSRGLAFDPGSQRGVVLMQVNPGQLFTFMAIEESPEALQLLLRDTRDALKRPAGTSYPVLTSLPGGAPAGAACGPLGCGTTLAEQRFLRAGCAVVETVRALRPWLDERLVAVQRSLLAASASASVTLGQLRCSSVVECAKCDSCRAWLAVLEKQHVGAASGATLQV